MKGDDSVLNALNGALQGELTAINMYFIQAKICHKWGYRKLGQKQYLESIEEMRHAEEGIERILYLDGLPSIHMDPFHIGTNVKEMFESGLELELKGVDTYNEGIKTCLSAGDAGSREILEHILVQTEKHVEWLESQLHLINEVGLDNYLADQIGEEVSS